MSESFELVFKPNLKLIWFNKFYTRSNKSVASSLQNETRYPQKNNLVMVFYPIKHNNNNCYYENEYINKIESLTDFTDTKNIDILLKIAKTIFDNYQICIYKKWYIVENNKSKIIKKIYEDIDIDNINSPSSNDENEIVSVIDILNKLAYLADIKPVILFSKKFGNKNIVIEKHYEECIKNNKFIRLGERDELLSKEKLNNILYYNGLIKGLDCNVRGIDTKLFDDIICSLICLEGFSEEMLVYINKVCNKFLKSINWYSK